MRSSAFLQRWALAIAACALQTGCGIVTPLPLWELVKTTGGLVGNAVSTAPPDASNTLYRLNTVPSEVCIEFNPQTQVADLVPILQAELLLHGVSSKVYDTPPAARLCNIWLEYAAQLEWGIPPFSGEPRAYMSSAQLALRSQSGELLSSSQFQLDTPPNKGKWGDTRSKLSPVVAALVTGY